MYLNQDLFIYPNEGQWILWDYRNHQQFEIDLDTWTRLNSILTTPASFDPESIVDCSLLQSGILSSDPPPRNTWGWDILSKIFHVGTKNIPFETAIVTVEDWAQAYRDHCNEVLSNGAFKSNNKKIAVQQRIELPSPNFSELNASLKHTLLNRQTCRVFHNNEVSLQDISTLLFLALGFTTPLRNTSGAATICALGERRTSPSGGGLNASEGYVYAKNIQGVKAGFYYYNPHEHTLDHRGPLSPTALGETLSGQHFINNLPMGIWLTSRLDKLWWKYEHSRAYRMALIEAGHVSQNVQLIATALKLRTWITGAFDDAAVENQLNIQHSHEQPLFFVGIGYGENSAIPIALEAATAQREAPK
jgi:SagB-type dehydrogenase family enzyme